MKYSVMELVRVFGKPTEVSLKEELTPQIWVGTNPDCIYCSQKTIKQGLYKGIQRFFCKFCGKTFLASKIQGQDK